MIFIKFKKFISSLRSISLSKNEREILRKDFLKKTSMEHIASPYPYFQYSTLRYCKIIAYSFILFLVGIVPLTFAASSSNPGDALYPIRVIINEPIKAVLKNILEPISVNSQEHIDNEIKKDEDSQSIHIINTSKNKSEDNYKNSKEKDKEENSIHTEIKIETDDLELSTTTQKYSSETRLEDFDIQKVLPDIHTPSPPKENISETQIKTEVKESIDLSL